MTSFVEKLAEEIGKATLATVADFQDYRPFTVVDLVADRILRIAPDAMPPSFAIEEAKNVIAKIAEQIAEADQFRLISEEERIIADMAKDRETTEPRDRKRELGL